jgi:UDP-N-acetylmuramate--alanine ligase
MPDLIPFHRVHVVGAAGAGMSGLAKVLSQAGHHVTGSDLKPSPALLSLQGAGIETWVGHRPERADEWDLVVASSAVPDGDPELGSARRLGVEVWHRPALLREMTRVIPTIGFAGTHGKTTTTAMAVTALRSLGRDPSFVVGGELIALNTNAHLGADDLLVLEADEAFGTFVGLELQALAVTNVEEDHLDHYGTREALVGSFVEVAKAVHGPVVLCADDPGTREVMAAVPDAVGYGTADDAVWRMSELEYGPARVRFRLHGRDDADVPVSVPKPGGHVARNAAAVIALLGELGFDVRGAAEGLDGFGGVRRRFEVRMPRPDVTIVDDYAHHPTEIEATIAAAARGHDGRVLAVFQPHRFTRTAELGAALGRALATATRVFVTDVYAAGEAPIPGVTGRVVADAVAAAGTPVRYVPRRVDLAAAIAAETFGGDLVLLLGAGDITLVADELAVLFSTPR